MTKTRSLLQYVKSDSMVILFIKRRLSCFFYGFVIFCVAMFLLLQFPFSYLSLNDVTHEALYVNKRILFVTAHPDDEVMFYGPTINSLRRIAGAENIFLLAITNGNYEGKGRIRETELVEGFKILELLQGNIYFYKRNNPLIDHPRMHLPLAEVAKAVAEHVDNLKIDLIITFDEFGVSHHINHGDIYRAINCCWPSTEKAPDALLLETLNYVRKHSSFLDFFATAVIDAFYNGKLVFLSGPADVYRTKTSLYVHKSQYGTFHNVLHHFSDRFLYINTLRKYKIPLKKEARVDK